MLMRSHAAGLLLSAGLAVAASAQTDIFWNAPGSGFWSHSANWNPLNVPDSAGENALLLSPSGAVVTLDVASTINDLVVGSGLTLVINPIQVLALQGDATNSGQILLNGTGSSNNAVLRFNADGALSGSGELRLAGGGDDAQLSTAGGAIVTQADGHTIVGDGMVSATLVNDGIIEAIDTGLGQTLELNTNPKVNNQTMRATADGVLYINGIEVAQGPVGEIVSEADGLVWLRNATVSGGTIAGPGPVRVLSGTTLLNGLMLDSDLIVESSTTIRYSGATLACTGTISLNDSGNSNNALLWFDSSTVLSGGGRIFLGGTSDDSQVNTNASTITVAPGFTIEGSGNVHASLVNNGVLRGVPSQFGDGRLYLIGADKTNNALIVAEAGGAVQISEITVSQGPAGEILADGGRVSLMNSQSITGGTLRNINGGVIVRENGGTTILTDVAIDGDLEVSSSSELGYAGSVFECTGTVSINDGSSSNNGILRFLTPSTATGGGRIFLGGSFDDSQIVSDSVVLTLAPGFTVEGSGDVHAAIANNGLVRAVPSFNGNGRITMLSQDKSNAAQMVAAPGGVLAINGITLSQTESGELLADGGVVSFENSQSVVGGSLRAVNGGSLVRQPGGTLTLSGVDILSDLEVSASSQVDYESGTLFCTASIVLNESGSSNNGILNFNADTTATGGGRIFLGGSFDDSQVLTNGTTLSIAPDFSIEGSGDVHAVLINEGVVRAFPSVHGNGRLNLLSGEKTNHGLMTADAGGVLVISGVPIEQGGAGDAGGTILANGGRVQFNGSTSVTGGVLDSAGGGVLELNGNLTLTGVRLDGRLDLIPTSTLTIASGVFVNEGFLAVNPTGSSNNSLVVFNTDTKIEGGGTVHLGGGGDDSQIISGDSVVTISEDQRLEGEGLLLGEFVMEGVLAPGLPIGPIGGYADLAFASSGRFEVEASSVVRHDRIDLGNGTASLDGLVLVQLREGYVPALNDQFNVLEAGGIEGLFDGVIVAVGLLPANFEVRLVYTPTSVDVKFVCISDLSPPFGVLDLADVTGFVSAFLSHDPLADVAEPIGLFDLADISTFIQNFLSGCN